MLLIRIHENIKVLGAKEYTKELYERDKVQ